MRDDSRCERVERECLHRLISEMTRIISAMAVEAEVVVGSSARSIGKSMVVVAMSATRASGASPLVARRVWRAENRRWT